MRPQLLSGLRHLRRHPGRVLQVVFAVALGVALFVSSYVSIRGVEESIRRTARTLAGNAQWIVRGSGAAGVPEGLVARLRKEEGIVAAPFLTASATVLGDAPLKLQVWGVDTQTDAMLRLYGARHTPSPDAIVRMALTPNSVLVSEGSGLRPGSTVRVATRSGASTLTVAGTLPDSEVVRAAGGALAFMDIRQAEALFGQVGRVDSIQVSGISATRLRELAKGYTVRPVDSLSPAAHDALLRVQSLYGLSLVAMLIGCFVVFSSVQVSVLERMKGLATFRAIGASRAQLLTAILIEWLLVGLVGSVAGVLLGVSLSSLTLRAITGDINSMVPVVRNAEAEISWPGFALGIGIGLLTVLAAALIPAVAAVGQSPLLALRPHTYRLKHRQSGAFWIGVVVLALGLGLSVTGTFAQTLAAIVLSFLGLALMLPHATLSVAAGLRNGVGRVFGFEGFLAADNLRKAPQRTAFNVIALGGALAIMVSTATLIEGLTRSTHDWIRASLPLDLSVTASDLSTSLYSEETLPRALLPKLAALPGVSFAYGVRKSFAPFGDHEIMVIGTPTDAYLEAHRRRGSLKWARDLGDPKNVAAMRDGTGIYASDNLLALTGLRAGDTVELRTPSGPRPFRILGGLEDYSWPRGLIIIDLEVMSRLWRSDALTYVDLQVANPQEIPAVKRRVIEATRHEYAAHLLDREGILAITDDVLRQTTSAADVQVWLAAIIGFLGIGNSLIVGVMQRQREIGLLRAVGMSRAQLARTVAIEALLIGIGAGLFGMAGGLVGGWLPLRHFTFTVTGFLFPPVVPWRVMGEVFVLATLIAVLAAIVPARRIAQVPVLTSIAVE
ncbi:MAG: FtsX-like permease family protein [Fimbriimonas sp.]